MCIIFLIYILFSIGSRAMTGEETSCMANRPFVFLLSKKDNGTCRTCKRREGQKTKLLPRLLRSHGRRRRRRHWWISLPSFSFFAIYLHLEYAARACYMVERRAKKPSRDRCWSELRRCTTSHCCCGARPSLTDDAHKFGEVYDAIRGTRRRDRTKVKRGRRNSFEFRKEFVSATLVY